MPPLQEPILVFSIIAAKLEQPTAFPNGLIMSFHVGKMQKNKPAKAAVLGTISHPGVKIATLDLYNAVQRLGGPSQVLALNQMVSWRLGAGESSKQ